MGTEIRTALKEGSIIDSKTQEYIIGEKLAEGGSCIVYYGTYKDNAGKANNVIIKELYPCGLSIDRKQNGTLEIQRESENSFEQSKSSFDLGYELQVKLRNDPEFKDKLVNSTSLSLDKFSSNNTEYIIMSTDGGEELAQVKITRIFDILEITLAVAKAIKCYHNYGYIHLDIKPQNIFKISETNQLIKLFDFDSVVKIEDVKNDNVPISYSNGYAAPEQNVGGMGIVDRSKIGIKTDFFAIGSILFEVIFGRRCKGDDLRSDQHDNYDKSASIFTGVNSVLFKEIKKFLDRTVVRDTRLRYKTDEELIKQLEKMVELANPSTPSIKSNFHKTNKLFVGRKKYIEDIHSSLSENHCVALSGIGGIGKTEIAKKYAEINESEYDNIIFAIYPSDILSLITDDNRVPINGCSIEGYKNADEYYEIKMRKLRSLCTPKTLFIIDTMNTVDTKRFSELMSLNCKFIITTRNDLSDRLNLPQLPVSEFDNIDDAYELFTNYYKKQLNEEQKSKIIELIERVQRHTLVVELIAKSMAVARISADKALDVIGGSELKFAKEKVNIENNGEFISDSPDNIIQKIFDIALLTEQEQYVLMNMSLIDLGGMPIEKFKDYCGLETYDDINALIDSGWIYSNQITVNGEEQEIISLHQVISDAVYKKSQPNTTSCEKMLASLIAEAKAFNEGKIEDAKEQARLLEFAVKRLKENNLVVCALYHNAGYILQKAYLFEQAISYYLRSIEVNNAFGEEDSLNVALSYSGIGYVYDSKGNYDKALEYYEKALKIELEILDEGSPIVADSYKCISYAYLSKCNYNKALEYHKKSLGIDLKVLGGESSDVAASYNNIGYAYNNKFNYEKALEYHENLLEIRLKVLGEDSPDVATSYNNIGEIYSNKDEYDKALEYHGKSLEINTKFFGEDSPEVAQSYNNIGDTYNDKGDYNKVLEYYEKALHIRLKIFGEESTEVATSYNNIGYVYDSKRNYDKALEYYKKSLEIKLKVLGEDHPDVATRYSNIAEKYYSKGNYDKTLEYYEKSLGIRLKVLGEDHPDVATSYNNIGDVFYNEKDNYDKAFEYYEKSLEIKAKIFGKDSPEVAKSYNNIGYAYNNKFNYDKALEYHDKALEINLKILGEDSTEVATSYKNIGYVYDSKRNYDKALEYYKKSLEIKLKVLGEDSLEVADSYNDIAAIHINKNTFYGKREHNNVIKYLKKALNIGRKIFGKDHPDVVTSYNNIGSAYDSKGDYDKALEYYEKSLEIRLNVLGEDSPKVAASYNNIGGIYYSKGDYDKALEYYGKLLKIILKIFGEDSPDVALSYDDIGYAYDSKRNYDKALEYYGKSLKIRLKIFGEDSPEVATSYNNIGWAYAKKGNIISFLRNWLKGSKIEKRLERKNK